MKFVVYLRGFTVCRFSFCFINSYFLTLDFSLGGWCYGGVAVGLCDHLVTKCGYLQASLDTIQSTEEVREVVFYL